MLHDCSDFLPVNTLDWTEQRDSSVSTTRAGFTAMPGWTRIRITFKQGQLFEYTKALRLYRCPTDKSTVRDLGRSARTRSYSLSSYMQSWPDPSDYYYPINWHKLADIRKPGPTKAFTFLDEHENSIFWGVFFVNSPGVWEYESGKSLGMGPISGDPAQQRGQSGVCRWPRGTLALEGTEHARHFPAAALAAPQARRQ